MAQISDYTSLITPYFSGQPNFIATITAVCQPFVDLQNLMASMPQEYDLDVAVGVQLDAVGIWVGQSRYITVPLQNLFFSFDDGRLGFDQGIWLGPYDSQSGLTSLDDVGYRTLLRAKIALNNWDGTLTGAETALAIVFPPTSVFLQDNADMTIVFGMSGYLPRVNGAVDLVSISLFANGYVSLKPEGVSATYLVTSRDGSPIFGFDVENGLIAGFDVGAWGVSDLTQIGFLIPAPTAVNTSASAIGSFIIGSSEIA